MFAKNHIVIRELYANNVYGNCSGTDCSFPVMFFFSFLICFDLMDAQTFVGSKVSYVESRPRHK
jgi:hypothetical protein